MAALLYALFRPRSSERDGAAGARRGEAERRFPDVGFVIGGGVVLPIVVLVPLAVYSLVLTTALAPPMVEGDFTVEVVGNQYWWEVRYPDHGFTTANEIHLPAGRPVQLRLTSVDVIHSFWVPRLMGKLDLLPGQTNSTWVLAERPGVYWGECAEFCGIQHAKMAFVVVADPPEQFAAWIAAQQGPAVEPADPLARRGAQVFARAGCISCHAIRYGSGVVGGGSAPDLTHFGSRLTIAAATLENNRGNLAGWVANSQAIKPGNAMPAFNLDGDSLLAVVDYLESLR
jgi:cytochrome c oxidase subunit 2